MKSRPFRVLPPPPICPKINKSPDYAPSLDSGAEVKPSSFVDTVYQQINSVIGGSNANQFLCLTIPGQALTAGDFAYDYKNNAPKGPTVEANESRLANKLFDPCRMTGADNGFTLPQQYRTALDMLTPKLNLRVANAKNELRQLLMTPYPYKFSEKDTEVHTLQEVFFHLYDDWVESYESWMKLQNETKEKMRAEHDTSPEGNLAFQDEYLSWYESVAQGELNKLNEKMSKVISVFTPNDMKILEGILDSGSGAELQEARQIMQNVQKTTPDGGYIYPVKFTPTSWFELLKTSFTPIDLLESPDILAGRMRSLSTRRILISEKINSLSDMVKNSRVDELKEKVRAAKSSLDAAKSELISQYGQGVSTVIDVVLDLASFFEGGNVPRDTTEKLAADAGLNKEQIKSFVDKLTSSIVKTSESQQAFINASQELADALSSLAEAEAAAAFKEMLPPLRAQLEDIDGQISELKMKIQLSALMHSGEKGKGGDKNISEADVAPPAVPEGYTQILITADASTLDQASEKKSDSKVSTQGTHFWFCGYSSESKESSASFKDSVSTANTKIQIGMNVAKVGIEREWFNPGVFLLTKDMYNVTDNRISPNPREPYTSITDKRLSDMASSVFPCYPTAMVIARDISIKLTSEDSISSSFSRATEKHASSGGGFLFFSGSKSSSSSSSESAVHMSSSGNTVSLKFTTPQIIGYYLEATPADKSTLMDKSAEEEKAGFTSISEFVRKYKEVLEKMNKTRSGELSYQTDL